MSSIKGINDWAPRDDWFPRLTRKQYETAIFRVATEVGKDVKDFMSFIEYLSVCNTQPTLGAVITKYYLDLSKTQ